MMLLVMADVELWRRTVVVLVACGALTLLLRRPG
jgi:hypothetical protein